MFNNSVNTFLGSFNISVFCQFGFSFKQTHFPEHLSASLTFWHPLSATSVVLQGVRRGWWVLGSPAPAPHVLLCVLAAEAGLWRADTAPSKVHHLWQPWNRHQNDRICLSADKVDTITPVDHAQGICFNKSTPFWLYIEVQAQSH